MSGLWGGRIKDCCLSLSPGHRVFAVSVSTLELVPFHLCSVDSMDLFNEQLKTHFSSISLCHLFLTVSDFIALDYSFMGSTSWSLSWNAPSEKCNLMTSLLCMSEGLVRWRCAWVKLRPIKFNIVVFWSKRKVSMCCLLFRILELFAFRQKQKNMWARAACLVIQSHSSWSHELTLEVHFHYSLLGWALCRSGATMQSLRYTMQRHCSLATVSSVCVFFGCLQFETKTKLFFLSTEPGAWYI